VPSFPTRLDDVWLLDSTRGTLARQTLENENLFPLWSPDESHAVMSYQATGPPNLHILTLDGNGETTRLLESEHEQFPTSWSANGRFIAYTDYNPETGPDIWIVDMEGEALGTPFQATAFQETHGVFSPDGKWLAYVSNETGRKEGYVRSASGPGKHLLSVDGGNEPVWARNGAELFYRNQNKMMVVAVETEPIFRPQTLQLLFEKAATRNLNETLVAQYDVSLDGQRFLMLEPVEPVDATEITLVQNWFQELKRLAPPPIRPGTRALTLTTTDRP